MTDASWSQGRTIPPVTLQNPYHVDHLILDMVTQLEPSAIADIGSANGRFAAELRPHRVVGVERDHVLATQARSNCAHVIEGDIEDSHTQDALAAYGPFDLILATDVIEHLVHPEATLRALAQILQPGGHLVISVPNLLYYRERIRMAFGYFETSPIGGLYDRTHLSFFSAAEFKGMLSRSDLVIERLIGAGRIHPGRRIEKWPFPAPQIKRNIDRNVAMLARLYPGPFARSLLATAVPKATP